MGKLKRFLIVYNPPNAVFNAGTYVTGKVFISLSEPMKMKCVKLLLSGEAKVHWSKTKHTGKSSHTVHYRGKENYFEKVFLLYGQNRGETTLGAGDHSLPFSFPLNTNLPSSFEGCIGHVRYCCKSTIVKPWKFDHDTKRAFTVVGLLDLNREQMQLQNVVMGRKTINPQCCCCINGSVDAVFRINKTGFVPGECILVYAKIENKSNTSVRSTRVSLKQYVTYSARSDAFFSSGHPKQKVRRNFVATKTRGVIQKSETKIWDNVPLQVPSLPPSRLDGCGIISISYVIKFYINVEYAEEAKLHCNVVIGTVPLMEAFSLQPPRQPQAITTQPTASAPPAYNEIPPGIDYDMPPPSYEESVQGKVHIKEEDDTDYTQGDMNWAPSYPFYPQLSSESSQNQGASAGYTANDDSAFTSL